MPSTSTMSFACAPVCRIVQPLRCIEDNLTGGELAGKLLRKCQSFNLTSHSYELLNITSVFLIRCLPNLLPLHSPIQFYNYLLTSPGVRSSLRVQIGPLLVKRPDFETNPSGIIANEACISPFLMLNFTDAIF